MERKTDTEPKPMFFLLEGAVGTIGPDQEPLERLNELTEGLYEGKFHVTTELTLPCGCIDGRCGCKIQPNAAGGTMSLMVADDLVNCKFAADDGTTRGAYEKVLRHLSERGLPIGGHDDEHKSDQKSGCGASDKLQDIYRLIGKKSGRLRELATTLGYDIDDATHELLVENAARRTAFSSGAEHRQALEDATDGDYDHLVGEHTEVVAVINTVQGTTLDRKAVQAEFGENYKVFNIDAWSFPEAAKVMSASEDGPEEYNKTLIAIVYYNLATALTLSNQNMRVIVR